VNDVLKMDKSDVQRTIRQFDNNSNFKKLTKLNTVPTTNYLKSFVLLRVVANFLNSLANLVPSTIKMKSEKQLHPLSKKY
jgi:hypothetical protein